MSFDEEKQKKFSFHLLNVRNRMPRCSRNENLNRNGSTTNSTKQEIIHIFNVAVVILK